MDRTTQYAKDVVAGRVIAGTPVKQACQRHLDDLKRSKTKDYNYRFDVEAAERALDIANIVATLSSMFKYSMDYADSLVPVGDEIEHLRSFLKIQAIRFPKKFTFEQITECGYRELHEVQIPKLVLQPIVENVFTHAFKKMLSSGRITLHLMVTDTDFKIMVSDNGTGISDEQVLALNRMFAVPQDEKSAMSGEHSPIQHRLPHQNVLWRTVWSAHHKYRRLWYYSDGIVAISLLGGCDEAGSVKSSGRVYRESPFWGDSRRYFFHLS